jgi:MFS family permease
MAHPRQVPMSARLAPRATTAAGLLLLVAASALLRTRSLDAGYWIDEGLAVGIASHPLDEIPGLLKNDGSPPLYYLLLALSGASGEVATRALSVVFALLTIPAALWAGRALFGSRAGWAAAAVAATAPLLTEYAQETRMYALLALLSVLACGAYALGFLQGRRPYIAAFVLIAALMLYTHNWALYLLVGLAAALPIVARQMWRETLLAGAAIVLLYAPWIPSLLHQAEHTGAPWSHTPNIHRILNALIVPLGASVGAFLAIAAAAYGLRRLDRERRRAAAALGIALLVGGVLAWVVAQVEPGWADRYTTAFMGPVVLLVGAGLAAAGRLGLAALAVVLVLFALQPARDTKSNVRDVAEQVQPLARAGDAAVAVHPEQVAVTSHYLRGDLRWATGIGTTGDPHAFDWTDATDRLERADPRATLDELLEAGARRVILFQPIRPEEPDDPPWRALVARKAEEWRAAADGHPELRRRAAVPPRSELRNATDVQAVVYDVCCRAP